MNDIRTWMNNEIDGFYVRLCYSSTSVWSQDCMDNCIQLFCTDISKTLTQFSWANLFKKMWLFIAHGYMNSELRNKINVFFYSKTNDPIGFISMGSHYCRTIYTYMLHAAELAQYLHYALFCDPWFLFEMIAPSLWQTFYSYPDSNVHGANMGPTWVLSAPDGPHVGPMNLAIRVVIARNPIQYMYVI